MARVMSLPWRLISQAPEEDPAVTTAVNIGPAHPRDISAMAGLLAQLFALEEDFAIDPAKQSHGLALLLKGEYGRLLVARDGDRVVGMVSGQLVISTAEGGPAVLVEDLVVDKAWQGRGVGRALLSVLGDWAQEQGARRLQLLADASNQPALDFYRHLGWQGTRLVCLRTYCS